MADLKAVQDAVQALTDEVAALSTAVTTEIARVEAVIAALSIGTVSQADLDGVVANLQTAVTNLKATQASADAERPTPATPPAA